jgi:hypothetical protein
MTRHRGLDKRSDGCESGGILRDSQSRNANSCKGSGEFHGIQYILGVAIFFEQSGGFDHA